MKSEIQQYYPCRTIQYKQGNKNSSIADNRPEAVLQSALCNNINDFSTSTVGQKICVQRTAKENIIKALDKGKLEGHMKGEINKNKKLVGGHIPAMVEEHWKKGNYECTSGTNSFKVKKDRAKALYEQNTKGITADWIIKNGTHTVFKSDIDSYDALVRAVNAGTETKTGSDSYVTLSNGQNVAKRSDGTVYPIE